MLISQIIEGDTLLVAVRSNGKARILNGERTVYSLALEAARSDVKLADLVETIGLGPRCRPGGRLSRGPHRLRRSAIPIRPTFTSPERASPISDRPRRAMPCTRSRMLTRR